MIKRPGGTAVILVTLALVIGTMSLAFGVIQFEQSRWMPFPAGERMVRFWQYGKQRPREDFPSAIYTEAADKLKGLDAVAALGGFNPQVLTGVGEPKSLSIQYITASTFDVAGIQPLLGRTFTAEEQRSGREDLLVIGFNAWPPEVRRVGLAIEGSSRRGDAAAGLLVRSYLNQLGFEPGFDTSRLIVVSASLNQDLYGIRSIDPLTYGTVGLVIFASALFATLLPSRRILRINPMEALRHE